MTSAGRIELVLGPMFCGKTTEMLRRVQTATLAACDTVVVKPRIDTRFDGLTVGTHEGRLVESTPATAARGALRVVATDALGAVVLQPGERVVGVDEGQFFGDLPEAAARWAAEGRRVVVAALDGDYLQRPFGRVDVTIPLSDRVVKLRGVCMACRAGESAFTVRTTAAPTAAPTAGAGDGALGGALDGTVLIGGATEYRAVCRGCLAAARATA